MEGPNDSAEKSEGGPNYAIPENGPKYDNPESGPNYVTPDSGPNCANSANATFSFEMLDMIITSGNPSRAKSQEETNRMTENTTQGKPFCPSEERVEISSGTKRAKRKSSLREQTTNSDEDAVEFKKQFHNWGKREKKKKKKVYNMNTEVAIGSGSEFSLLGEFLPVEGIPDLASSKEEMSNLGDLVDCLSGGNSSGGEHYHMGGESDKRSATNERNEKHMNEQDVDAQLAKMQQADEEVLLSRNIDCTNCKYYLKELTSRNYMDFSYMDQYISEGESNLLLLKNKKIEELENGNKLMKRKMSKLKEENNFLSSKLDTLAESLSDLRDHFDKLVEENKSLKEENKRLSGELQKGQTCKEEVEGASKKDAKKKGASKKDASSSSHGRRDPPERDFENSIDNELFNELS
ncbi:conserved Plasmodium protein, unknown function [Plasmodium vivax]|uniref:Uncharacterized protein n=5 Tax=Plasmodium vivax TaxID=5855 RepID=A5K284_PLAVS|nr:hypothetical protein, conserved [Plasmodium vivax]KMZ85600.1 hypothetical protein PVBG_01112 [Plasmodium vivax Brazil I]KMZ92075.1 hypothetical protein PVMG_02063 [Plasmodium vivax Mauritania I]KMZ98736.1 hypothetical protein PVNG_03596 [Plasmodium vivax North Korean]EDL46534.1 hypothetical protein, conserved [Plasmodium vivax]CAG9477850.1 unnamed protein product [Plasmodium vivax]|eukprot:XP_001616261.1 hypothetical protein [Plasmodium vivax Sal-1]